MLQHGRLTTTVHGCWLSWVAQSTNYRPRPTGRGRFTVLQIRVQPWRMDINVLPKQRYYLSDGLSGSLRSIRTQHPTYGTGTVLGVAEIDRHASECRRCQTIQSSPPSKELQKPDCLTSRVISAPQSIYSSTSRRSPELSQSLSWNSPVLSFPAGCQVYCTTSLSHSAPRCPHH